MERVELEAAEQTKLYEDYIVYTVILISNIISILLMNKYIMLSNGIFTTVLILKINHHIRSTLLIISILLIPLMIGLTSTNNKVEGIIKGIVGSLIVYLPSYFFKELVLILEGSDNKNSGLQGLGTFLVYSTYVLVVYITVIIMMLKTTN